MRKRNKYLFICFFLLLCTVLVIFLKLQTEIPNLQAELSKTNIENLISEGNNKIENIKIEMEFPSNQNINMIVDKIKDFEIRLANNDQRQKELEDTLHEIDDKLKIVKTFLLSFLYKFPLI